MTVYLLASGRGAPGVTTTAVRLAGCMTNGLVAEADLYGGVLALRFGLGREPGLTTLAASGVVSATGWQHHAQQAGELPVLVGPDASHSATALWSRVGSYLAEALAAADADVVIDAGRLRPDQPRRPLLAAASIVAMVCRPVAEELVAVSRRLAWLRDQTSQVGVILAGQGPYRSGDVSEQLGVEVLGVLPGEARGALLASRGELSRHIRTLAEALIARAGDSSSVVEVPA